jgi:acyl-CoA thioesterase-1
MLRIFALLLCLIAGTANAAGNISPTILVFGDSLSAGYGIAIQQSWPALLQARLQQEHFPQTVVNASISGETTAGGRSRLPDALKQHRPQIVILALGANDGLRGLPLDAMRANLEAMVRASRAAGARVLLAGMQLPPNYGPDFTRNFNGMFATVAKQEKAALLPFLLEPVALDDAAFQSDRLHPTAAAQPKILDHVWRSLEPLLKPR